MVSPLTILLLRQAIDAAPKFSTSDKWYQQVRTALPYVIEIVPQTGEFIILNRHYKPIGIGNTYEYLRFQNPCFSGWRIQRDEFDASRLNNLGGAGNYFYLYQDSYAPWRSKQALENYKLTFAYVFHKILTTDFDVVSTGAL